MSSSSLRSRQNVTPRWKRGLSVSIYLTHGESTKDKEFELEMSWISTSETNNLHQPVPKDLLDDAEAKAKAEDEDEEMGDAQ